MRSFYKFVKQFKETSWKLGILLDGYDSLKKNEVQWVKNTKYPNKWFADPFILDYNDEIINLLVEEFDYEEHKGRIAKITINRKYWNIIDCKLILDLDTHLSFPAIYRHQNKIYVCPENYNSGAHHLYEYNSKGEKLELIKTLYDDKLTDAIIYNLNDKFYMFTTYVPTPNGSKLTILRADHFMGPYNLFQKVSFNDNIGRNAGHIFSYNEMLVRPAQESNFIYGHALVFQKVTFQDGMFQFEELERLNSAHSIYNVGMHTFNVFEGMGVVDVKGYRYPILGHIINGINKLLLILGLKKLYSLK